MLEMSQASTSNITFFIVINLNIILVMVLGFLVIKNLVRLVLDRRRNILGAKLRTRLVLAFMGLSLVPTVLLFLVAKGMLQKGFNEWLSPQIEVSTESALSLAKLYYKSFEEDLRARSEYFREHLESLSSLLEGVSSNSDMSNLVASNNSVFNDFIKEKIREYNLYEAALVDAQGKYAIRVSANSSEPVSIPEVNVASVYQALDGHSVVRPEQSLDAEFLRAYIPIGVSNKFSKASNIPQSDLLASDLVLVTTVRVAEDLSKSLGEVINAFDDFRELKTFRRPLASSYLLTLIVVTLLIIFGAIWVGFYLARELSIPIGLLAEGTQQLAGGNLSHRIPETGDDELSVLVRSFNKMTQDLADATGELTARRNYIETLVESVGVGVISVDDQNQISTCNPAAKLLLGIDYPARELKNISDLPDPLNSKLLQMLDGLKQEDLYSTSGEAVLSNGNRNLHLTLTRLVGQDSKAMGAVILLDDLTELVSVQRMAAWQEVARRIAHEIKNPLTPIRLSAERIQRKFGLSSNPVVSIIGTGEREIINESMQTIVKQVESLRNLVNEFSQFARMPKAKLQVENLNTLVANAINLYRGNYPDINFIVKTDSALPEFQLDSEQISRVIVNLLENSISAHRKLGLIDFDQSPTQIALRSVTNLLAPSFNKIKDFLAIIEISTQYDSELGIANLVVADNGIGIAAQDKKKLFEPYFSFTEGGTGLGLAIVHNIVSDHNGFIRVKDNHPRGAIIQIELPVVDVVPVRKLA